MTKDSVLIGFVGDIALTHDYDVLYSARGPDYPFEFIQDTVKGHDFMVGNLEAPFCLGGETYPLKLSLRAHPGYAQGLMNAGFTAFTLGNNHILDYREQAFYETLGILDSHGLKWCGAGEDVAAARRPAIMEKHGVTIAVFSCCDVPIDSPFYASKNERGIAPLDLAWLEKEIACLRREVDIIVVSPHWGKEDWHYPNPCQVKKARLLIDLGADLVVGHHPHVVQGVERYKKGFIAYSLGNFLFSDVDWRWLNLKGELKRSRKKQNRARRQTLMLSAEVAGDGVRGITMTPCLIGEDLRIRPVDRNRFFQARMRLLSKPLSIRDYEPCWARYDAFKAFETAVSENARRLRHIHRLRASHIEEFFATFRMLRSQRPV